LNSAVDFLVSQRNRGLIDLIKNSSIKNSVMNKKKQARKKTSGGSSISSIVFAGGIKYQIRIENDKKILKPTLPN
jgi:hypothetical protein